MYVRHLGLRDFRSWANVELDLTPQEVSWDTRLDEDLAHARYDTQQVTRYFAAATQASLVLAAE